MTDAVLTDRLEARVFGLELREVETTANLGMIRGMAVPYGEWANIGWFMESFRAGSLTKSISEAARRLPLNLFHDNRSYPIGSADEWTEEDRGLFGTWRLTEEVEAQRAARLAESGDLTGLSIEFAPIRSQWTEAHDWNPDLGPDHLDKVERLEARLGAVALCQTPAYVSAGVQLVRSADALQRRQVQGTPVLDEMRRRTNELRSAR